MSMRRRMTGKTCPALFFLLLFTGLFFVLIQPAAGQNSVKPAKGREQLVVNVDLVNVLFTVSDRRGRLITDLDQADFQLFENNRPQVITNFSRETDLPLAIALLLDTSTSIRDRFKFEQEAAIDFLTKALRGERQGAVDDLRHGNRSRAGFY